LKRFTNIVHIVICSFIWLFHMNFQQLAYAVDSLGDGIDCTDVSVDYLENSTLTKEERIRLMDKAFFQSLNKFELCQEAKKMAAAAGGGSGSGSGGGGGGGGGAGGEAGGGSGGDAGDVGAEGGMSTGESVASSTMSGTEPPTKYPSAEGGDGDEGEESGSLQGSQDVAEAGSKTGGNMQSSNGKLPDDIPPAKNDDALAAQIRYAAENETDPVKSKQLWNEYRKYKGLPTK
jgi:hypothetical protein